MLRFTTARRAGWVPVYRADLARVSQESQGWSESDPACEALRNDLVAYLACRLDVSPEVVLARLGDWLLEPVAEERRQEYARATYLRRGT